MAHNGNRWIGNRLLAGFLGLVMGVSGSFIAGKIIDSGSVEPTPPRTAFSTAAVLPQVTFTPFRMLCPFTHSNNDDPVVNTFPPGAQGASHKHRFFGNPTTKWNSTYATQVAAAGTCERRFGPASNQKVAEPKDTAGYWIPFPIFSGLETYPNEGAIAWYSNPEACPSSRVCKGIGKMPVNYTFPKDFRMIVGSGSASSSASNPAIASDNIFFNCYPALGKTVGDDNPNGLNECATLGGNRADIWMRFPSCWVGRGGPTSWKRDTAGWVLDSPNHRDHMAYPTTVGCPASHPVVLPQLTVQIPFPVKPPNLPPVNGSTMSFSSGKWWTLHFDLWQTWNQLRFEQLTAPSPPG